MRYVKKRPYSFNSCQWNGRSGDRYSSRLPHTHAYSVWLSIHVFSTERQKKPLPDASVLSPPLLLQITLLCPPLAPADSSVVSTLQITLCPPLAPSDSSVGALLSTLQITLLCPPLALADSSVGAPLSTLQTHLSCPHLQTPLWCLPSLPCRFLWQQLISREIKRNRRGTSACLLFPDIIS